MWSSKCQVAWLDSTSQKCGDTGNQPGCLQRWISLSILLMGRIRHQWFEKCPATKLRCFDFLSIPAGAGFCPNGRWAGCYRVTIHPLQGSFFSSNHGTPHLPNFPNLITTINRDLGQFNVEHHFFATMVLGIHVNPKTSPHIKGSPARILQSHHNTFTTLRSKT